VSSFLKLITQAKFKLMRRDLNKPEVPWGIRVSSADNEALSAVLPMNGGKTWLVIAGLKAFLELMENSPEHREWAHRQIAQHSRDPDRPRYHKELSFRVPTDLYIRFNQLFPQIGASSWFIRTLVSGTISDMQEDGPSLEERVGLIVNKIMRPTEDKQETPTGRVE
jgi:hypothetical protein